MGKFACDRASKTEKSVGSRERRKANALVQVLGFDDAASVAEALEALSGGQIPDALVGHLSVTIRYDETQAAPGPPGPMHTLRFESPAPYIHPTVMCARARAATGTAVGRCWSRGPIAWKVPGCCSGTPTPRATSRPGSAPPATGSVRQGALIREQTFTNRPHPDCATTRTPIPGMYLGGGAPPIGETGAVRAPGLNEPLCQLHPVDEGLRQQRRKRVHFCSAYAQEHRRHLRGESECRLAHGYVRIENAGGGLLLTAVTSASAFPDAGPPLPSAPGPDRRAKGRGARAD